MTDPPPTRAESIRDLMEKIAVYQDSEIPSELKIAELALQQLLADYGRLVWALVHDRLGPIDKDAQGTLVLDRNDIFNRLVLRIWKYSASFDPNGTDPEGLRKQFVSWAATILRNIVNDVYKGIQTERDQVAYLEETWDGTFPDGTEESDRVRIVREVLDEMDPDDVEVLRWSAPLIPLDETTMKPDPEERDAICQQLGVTPEGLRTRRSRAFKKLKAELETRLGP